MFDMKKIIVFSCAIFYALTAHAEDEKIVKSSIKSVTVYSQGAQIYRKSTYTVSKGVTQVIIEGVSPRIDPKSLQVRATGDVIILDSKYSIFYPEPEEVKLEGLPLKIRKSIALLEDSLENVNFDLQMLQDEIDVLVATKNILKNNGAIRGQGKVNDSIALLKEAVEYYTAKMMEVNRKLLVLNRSKSGKNEIKAGMTKRMTDLKNFQQNANLNQKPKGPFHRITVTLKANTTINGKLDVSYLVSNAGWVPMYDLRSELSNGKVNLNYKAQVYQNTGIDWDGVRLNISTNNPYQNKTKPTLHPWYVDYYTNSYRLEEKNKSGRGGIKKEGYTDLYNSGSESVAVEEAEMDAQFSDQFVEVIDHMISAEFRIDLPYSIKSDGEQHMVLIKNEDLDADYKYYTVPKIERAVYLVAQISKLDELQLVPAKANIFFDGSYIGETYLDPTTMDDTLHLSLGKDPSIIVKRTLLEKECKEKIVGTKKEQTYAYAIELKNLKSTSIDIVVQDQIPVTTNPDIEIESVETSKGDVDKRSGVIEWEFTLRSKAEKELLLTYRVKHDKEQVVYIN